MGQECAFPHRGRCLEGYTAADLLPKPTAHLRCGWVNWLRQAAGPTPTLPAAPHRQRVPFGLLLGITQPQTLREGAPAAALWDTAGGDTTPGLLRRCPNPRAAPGAAHSSSRTQKTSGKEGKRHRTTAGHPAGGEGGGTHPSIHPSGSERSSRRAGRAGRASASPISFVIRSQHARFYI